MIESASKLCLAAGLINQAVQTILEDGKDSLHVVEEMLSYAQEELAAFQGQLSKGKAAAQAEARS